MLDDPAVNFAVSTGECCGEDRNGVSHLGIQVDDDESLAAITGALTDAEHSIFEERERTCCYARGNKTWAADPDGVVWETFHRLGHSDSIGRGRRSRRQDRRPARWGSGIGLDPAA